MLSLQSERVSELLLALPKKEPTQCPLRRFFFAHLWLLRACLIVSVTNPEMSYKFFSCYDEKNGQSPPQIVEMIDQGWLWQPD